MEINLQISGQTATLALTGRIDTLTAPELDKVIQQLSDITTLVLDMAEISYISSAGLRVLLSAQKKMQKVGSLQLKNVCLDVMEVFEMTGFADILTIV